MELAYVQKSIPYKSAFELYKKISREGAIPALLMESRTINLAYGNKSVIASNLALKVSGKNEKFRIDALSDQGMQLLRNFSGDDFPFTTSYLQKDEIIEGSFSRDYDPNQDLNERIRGINATKFLRAVIRKFQTANPYAGLYGAFAYDFIRNFEDIGRRHDKEPGEDFALYLPARLTILNDITQVGTEFHLRVKGDSTNSKEQSPEFNKSNIRYESMSEEDFTSNVKSLIADVRNGRFMQCVLSRSISVPLVEHPLNSYKRLREINPSPYCFFFNLGSGEYLYGSSPEVHAVVENNMLTIRPLAGTIGRSKNPLEDADSRIKLLTDQKERREHMMLVDLGRNDVYRLCELKSVEITDLLTVEEYPNLYHLASGIRGKLRNGFDSADVMLTTIPSGTLSGAPKLEAMKAIEELENTRRGFYGGAVGYVTFNGECNTGITIRSVQVNNGFSTVQAGAGIVADSIPENEVAEVNLKLEKPLKNLEATLK